MSKTLFDVLEQMPEFQAYVSKIGEKLANGRAPIYDGAEVFANRGEFCVLSFHYIHGWSVKWFSSQQSASKLFNELDCDDTVLYAEVHECVGTGRFGGFPQYFVAKPIGWSVSLQKMFYSENRALVDAAQ
jgi:hypothetical protein